jgi:subtilisin family serine protease
MLTNILYFTGFIITILMVWFYTDKKTVLSIAHNIKNNWYNNPNKITQMLNVRTLLGVNKYHNINVKGQRVKIGIIDVKCSPHPRFKAKMTRANYHVRSTYTSAHGTHVMGIIHNIAPNAEYYSYNILEGETATEKLGLAIRYMADQGVSVINMSISKDSMYGRNKDRTVYNFGYNKYGHVMYKNINDIFEYLEERGVIIVIAAGNQGSYERNRASELLSDLTQFSDDKKFMYGVDKEVPISKMSSWPIIVSSCGVPSSISTPTDGFSSFNTINKTVDVMSYGENISSFDISNGYTDSYVTMSGTSMASPQVAGCIALILDYIYKSSNNNARSAKVSNYAKQYMLNECTYRDVNDMVKYLPKFKQFIVLDSLIDKNKKELLSHTKSRLSRQLILLSSKIRVFFNNSSVLHDNKQFKVENVKVMPVEELIKKYKEVKIGAMKKYTILALGYGILSLKLGKFPDMKREIVTKPNFDYDR